VKYTLHTAKLPDWKKPGKGPKNIWQKIALKSYGAVTPGNLASLGGGIVAIYGLGVILNGEIVKGLGLLAIGRMADVADGIIAERTKTKSPLGEIIDASIDKFVLGSTLLVLGAIGLVPWIIVLFVALQNLANIIISVVAKLREKTIHPSRIGKVSAAFSWVTIILYPFGDWLQLQGQNHDGTGTFLMAVAVVSFGIYVIMGLQASLGYGLVIYQKPAKKLYGLFR
jgi:phosphatidylglycerophosphate synthase